MRRFVVMALIVVGGMLGDSARADSPAPSAGVRQVTLFREGEGPYNNYRIPAAIRTTRGTVLAFCEGRQTPHGSGNDTGEINVILRRSADGGRSFGPLQVVWVDGKNTCGNPCPVVDESTGTVWLLMTHNLGGEHEREINAGTSTGTRTVWVTSSEDDGVTWGAPREITAQVKAAAWRWFATGPGVGIQMKHGPHAGRLVVPCDYSRQDGTARVGNSLVIFSDDHGTTWKAGGEAPGLGFNECQVVELTGGRLMLNMRNLVTKGRASAPRQRGVCVSEDGGATFGDVRRDPALPEPICEASILRYSWPGDGERSRVLFSNPASPSDRVRMTVRLSYDEGSTWPVGKEIFAGLTGYSSLVTCPDGAIGLLYEAGEHRTYERIDFATFDLGWLTAGSDAASVKP